jgi:tetratricopeptide (TPR) repeat protein
MARVALQDYLNEARELINGQAFDEAIAICRHILLRYPKHIRTYQILGEACLEKGETDEAIAVFKRLLDHADPENFSAYAGLGVAYEDLGQLPQAIWYMERAFELAPNTEDARDALRRLYQKRDGSEPDRIRHNKVALARLYAKGGQYQQAIQELRLLLDTEPAPGRLDLRLSLAETLWRDGRREQAADVARSILQTAPDCLKAILLLGKILIEKGRCDEGVAILVRTRALDPENLTAQALFGADSPLTLEQVMIPRIQPRATQPAAVEPPIGEPAEDEAVTGPQEAIPSSAEEVAETPVSEAQAQAGESEPALRELTAGEAILPAPVLEVAVPAAEADGLTLAPPPEPRTADEVAAATEPAPPESPEEGSGGPEGVTEQPVTTVEGEAIPGTESTVQETAVTEVPGTNSQETVIVGTQESADDLPSQPAAVEIHQVSQVEPAPTELAITELTGPVTSRASVAKRRRKKLGADALVLEAMSGVSAGLLSEIERCRQVLEQKPKDDEARLALARAYRDAAQIKLALQEYDTLAHSKTKKVAEVVADMEGLVASRPDNLEAHELLADAYAKNGQLQKALERYRWVLERMRESS